jgi:hypothetical protein
MCPLFFCVAFCVVFYFNVVRYFVLYMYLCVVSYCSTTAPGKYPFAVQLSNSINKIINMCCVLLELSVLFL